MNAVPGTIVTNCKISLIIERLGRLLRQCLISSLAAGFFSSFSPVFAEESRGDSASKEIENLVTIYGVDMDEAFSRNIFTHWRFRPVGVSVSRDGYTEMLFRLPRSSRFRPFVNFYVTLNADGKIIRANMQLRRRFIQDKVQGAFARDMAKTFVQAAVPADEIEKVHLITNEIFFRQAITRIHERVRSHGESGETQEAQAIFKIGTGKLKEGDIVITGKGGALPVLPKKTSALYKAFVGETKSSRLVLDESILKFVNQPIEGEETLVISTGSKTDEGDVHKNVEFELDYGNMPMHIP